MKIRARTRLGLGGAITALTLGLATTTFAENGAAPEVTPVVSDLVNGIMGLTSSDIVVLDVQARPGEPFNVRVGLDGSPHTLVLEPFSIRAPDYQLLVQRPDGTIVAEKPGPEMNYRGTIAGADGSVVTASVLEDGLHAMVQFDEDRRFWIEPLLPLNLETPLNAYVIYTDADVLPTAGKCGMTEVGDIDLGNAKPRYRAENGIDGIAGGGPCIAELACDADTEYFNDYGTVAATEARINSVINTVNLQYEGQVGITHQITTILVRTGSDPYTSLDAQTRLCQFITEWSNNQQAIQRDVAHLFVGAELSGSTIGIAADIGQSGICQVQGDCVSGQYGTFGSYCLSQSDFNNNFSCATDLTAHELGHLWGAFHCNCSGNTMNSSITCANSFSAGSINSITAYRDTRTCLGGTCPGPPPGPENDACSDAIPFNSGNGDGTMGYTTTGTSTDGPTNPANTCNDFGQNQTHNDIWYTYTASCSGTLTVTTCDDLHGQGDPTYDTDLVLYGPYGSVGQINCGTLSSNLAACNDDDTVNGCGTSAPYSSTINITVSQGETYLIRVGGWSSADSGSGSLMVDCDGTTSGGACCFNNGSCIETDSADCANQGGTYQGDGTTCAADDDGDGTPNCADGCPNDPNKTDPGTCGCGVSDADSDGDGTPDCNDGCPNDPNKTDPGTCGCGTPDADSDGDGVLDCQDGCPNDPNKTAPGQCGCGVADTDSDGDGTADCNDGCPNDPNKTAPGACGCGVPDTDSDGDGTPDCNDGCPNDPNKTDPGTCGCGVSDADSDGDGTPDCNDGCPNDPDKTDPGICGCGVFDGDSDGDGVLDCDDGCPFDPDKTDPGACGCGNPDVDSDGDGTLDCNDGCPNDPNKTAPGDCGCGVPDTDSDGDGTADCNDGCPNDPNKTAPGDCGCGVPDVDSDGDGTADCADGCPNDPNKTDPGTCGCGVSDADSDGDGVADCDDNCPGEFNPGQEDCDGDGTGDACSGEPDCNSNGVPDSCDITNGTSADTDGNGVPDECEQGGGNGLLEAGTVMAGGSSVTVNLQNTYTTPVVVCSVNYANNTVPVVVRVNSVSSNSFNVRLQNPSNASVVAERVSYIVMEEGVYTINGVNIEAQQYLSTNTGARNNSWSGHQLQSYGQSYSNPVVIGQVMTENDADWSTFWNRGSGRNSPPSGSILRTGKQVAEDSDITRGNETVGFIVIEAGHGTIGGVEFEALLGADSVRGVTQSPPYNYNFTQSFATTPSIGLHSQAAMDGNNGGWSYTYGANPLSSSSISLAIDEDQIRDNERNHTHEQVGYFVIAGPVSITQ